MAAHSVLTSGSQIAITRHQDKDRAATLFVSRCPRAGALRRGNARVQVWGRMLIRRSGRGKAGFRRWVMGGAVAALASAGGVVGVVVPAGAQPPPSCAGGTCTVTYSATGSVQYWDVPTAVTVVTITASGGSGGTAFSTAATGGAGGEVSARVAVTPGSGLQLVVGLAGGNGSPPADAAPAAGGYGGGGSAGVLGNTVNAAGGGGGGGTFVFAQGVPEVIAGGGGGAAGGLAYASSVGGAGGAGGDAPAVDLAVDPLSGAGATTTGPGAGAKVPPSDFAGSDGTGPASGTADFGVGGAGATNKVQVEEGTAGGGGGGLWGGGGGGSDTGGKYDGAGGGGSGYLASAATLVSRGTHRGDGEVTISYAGAETTTSGVLRDAATGAPIPNTCVVFSPADFPGETNYTSVNGNGHWSFTSTDAGPFNLAFYATADGDCSQPILPRPVPSWYVNKVLTGTDEHTITPPPGAATVAAGASGIIACLGATALPTKACVIPKTFTLSGRVVTRNDAPVAKVCVFVLSHQGDGDVVLTDAAGRWSVDDVPAHLDVVVAFVPYFTGRDGDCSGDNGPPVPGPGQLQPVFYADTWANLADPALLADAYTWGVAHGAVVITAPSNSINGCLTSAPGTAHPRPSCDPPTPPSTTTAAPTSTPTTPATATTAPSSRASVQALANTGTPSGPLLLAGASAIALGIALLVLATRRRKRPPNHCRTI
jgi:hypothetical protein